LGWSDVFASRDTHDSVRHYYLSLASYAGSNSSDAVWCFQFASLILMSPIVGALGIVVGFGAYAFHAVRNVEDILRDYDAKPCSTENENQPITK